MSSNSMSGRKLRIADTACRPSWHFATTFTCGSDSSRMSSFWRASRSSSAITVRTSVSRGWCCGDETTESAIMSHPPLVQLLHRRDSMRMVVEGSCLKVVNLSHGDDARSRAQTALSRCGVSRSLGVRKMELCGGDRSRDSCYVWSISVRRLCLNQLSRVRGWLPGRQACSLVNFFCFSVHNKTPQHHLYDRHRVAMMRHKSGKAFLNS